MPTRERELDERTRCLLERLSGIERSASLGFAIELGRAVVDTLYAGDPGAWRRRERKAHALRSLARRPELGLSTSALYRALALYELSQRQGARDLDFNQIGVSHSRAVLGLPVDVQCRLLMAAARQGWTATRLEREARGHRGPTRARGGRRPIAAYIKSIRRIFQLTSPEALAGVEGAFELDESELLQVSRELAEARARLERLERALPRRCRAADGAPELPCDV